MRFFDLKAIKRKTMTIVLALAVLVSSIPIGLVVMATDPESFTVNFSSDNPDLKLNAYRVSNVTSEKVTFADNIAEQEGWGRIFSTVAGTSIVVAPKNSFNNDAKLKNFEATFNVTLHAGRSVALTFRSSNKARLYKSDGSNSGTLISLILTGTGYTVADTADTGTPLETSWNDGVINPTWCEVTVKVVGNKLSLKVIAVELGDQVIAETESDLVTDGDGYIYFSMDGNWVGLRYLKFSKLDDNGDVMDWNESVVPEVHTSFSAPIKTSCANAAAIDETVNVYYDQSASEGGDHKLIKVDSIADNAKDAKYGGLYDTIYKAEDWPLIETDNRNGNLLKNSTSFVPKLSDGVTEAKVENFETTFGLLVFNDSNMGIALSFRSDKPGAMLNDDGNAGYAKKVTLHINHMGWNIYDGTPLNYCNPEEIPEENKWANGTIVDGAILTVYVKVLGNKLTLKVNQGDQLLYDNTSAPYTIERTGAGYMYYSMLSNWTWAGCDIVCDRLDPFGSYIDWDDESYNTSNIKTFYCDFADATSIDKMLNVYYDQSTSQGTRSFARMDSIADNAADAKYGLPYSTTYTSGVWPMIQTTNRTGYLLNNSTSFSPKLSDGITEAMMRNFETTFSPLLFDDINMGFAISFRSDKSGVILDENGKEGYANKVTLLINHEGWNVYDGVSLNYSDPIIPNENKWADNTIIYGACVNVYLKVVGNKMTLKVTYGSKLLYDNTDNPYTINLDGEGYIYYSYLTNWSFAGSSLVCKRLDDNGKLADWDAQSNGEIVITSVEYDKEITLDRSKNKNFILPKYITGKDDNGFEYSIPVTWSNADYRSYKSGKFDFVGTLTTELYNINNIPEIKITVNNVIDELKDADGNIASKTWYFDNENDLNDFTCRLSSYDIYDSGTEMGADWHDVVMNKVEASDYWKVEGGRVVSNYSRTLKSYELNGKTRSQDVSTLLLDKDLTNSLINFKIEVDYTHSTDMWYPYVIFGVQDTSAFYGDLYVNPLLGNKETGFETDVHGRTDGGTYVYMEEQGVLSAHGACELWYNCDFSEGQDFMKTYNRYEKHTMKITVLNGDLTIQIDDSDLYFGSLPEAALGGYIGIGSSGTSVSFDNLRIIAIDDFGEPMSYEAAEKGFAPADFEDTYTGWQPTAEEADFKWGSKYN